MRGIDKMVEEDRYCIDVLTQIGAIQAALDKVALGLLDEHAQHCVMGAAEAQPEKTDELMAAVARLTCAAVDPVVVVGAGFAGLAAATTLADRGVESPCSRRATAWAGACGRRRRAAR